MKIVRLPGKINKDSKEELLKPDEVRHKKNFRSKSTDSNHMGCCENIKGNVKINNPHIYIPPPPPPPVEVFPVLYGLLYNLYAATDERKITSAGDFVVPSVEDWETLLNYVDDIDETGQWPLAGGKLKENGTVFWGTGNVSTNEYNLNIRGAGRRGLNDDIVGFQEINVLTRIHALNSSDLDNAYYLESVFNVTDCFIDYEDRWAGHSIRLVRPATESEILLPDGLISATYSGNDGKVYRCTKIGTQVWVADNLCETMFRDGSLITEVKDNTEWSERTEEAMCAYDNDWSLVYSGGSGKKLPDVFGAESLFITASSAEGGIAVNPHDSLTTVIFEWGTTDSYGESMEANEGQLSGEGDSWATILFPNLDPNTTYHWRISATNYAGTVYSEDKTFTTSVALPVLTNHSSTPDTEGALLSIDVNVGGASTLVTFQYGTSVNYDHVSSETLLSNDTSTLDLSGYDNGTTIYWRVRATNSAGTVYSGNYSFTTLAAAPEITDVYSECTISTATLYATINSNGGATDVIFEYESDVTSGNEQARENPIESIKEIFVSIIGLIPDKEYTYRVVATNSAGETTSDDYTFTTLSSGGEVGAPEISNESESFLTDNRIRVSADIDTKSSTTSIIVEYGTTNLYGSHITLSSITTNSNVNGVIPRRTPGVYHYRFVATNEDGITAGADQTFTIYPGVNRDLTDYSSALASLLATFTGSTYYIDPSYSGGGYNGSLSTPFNSWLQVPALTGGNKYLMKYGTTWTSTSSTFRTVSGRFMIGAYGDPADGLPEIYVSNSAGANFIDSAYQMYIRDIKIRKNGINGIGVYMQPSPNSWFYNVVIDGFRWPIYTEAVDYITQWDGLKILYCTLHSCGFDGLNARYSSQIEIGHSYIYDVNRQYLIAGQEHEDDSPGDNLQFNSGGIQVIRVHHCTLDHSSTGNKFNIIVASRDAIFECDHNHMIGSRSFSGHPVSALYLGGNSIDIHHNIFDTHNYALYNYGNNTRFNYNIVNNVTTGVQILNNRSAFVYNNVFHNYTSCGIVKLSGASINARNNVFKSSAVAFNIGSGGTVVRTNNHFDGCTASGTNNTTGSSMFTDDANKDYMPATGSPLINSGVNVGLTTDFDGVAVSDPPSKGILE